MHIAKWIGRSSTVTFALSCLPLLIIAQSTATWPVQLSPAQAALCDPRKTCGQNLCDPPTCVETIQDYQQMLGQLHITSMRPGPGNRKDAPPANYDESKANLYPDLPNPLILNNGMKVTTAKMWWEQRRPQIAEYFDRDVYGRVPPNTPKVTWEVVGTTKKMEGKFPVIAKQVIGHVDNSSYPLIIVNIQLSLTTPANATGSVPVIMEFRTANSPAATTPQPSVPGGSEESLWKRQILEKGWGYAVIIGSSIQADNGAGLTRSGIIGLIKKGQFRKPDDWGVLRAWAWGASRAMDFFETEKSVDAKQVGVEGHSRSGKAALVAMAYDQRFAIAYVSSSGRGGAGLYRRDFGERLEDLTSEREYHWFAGNFLKYGGPLTSNDLPIDSHELIAMCAPRPVFISGGSTIGPLSDAGADAQGMFMAAAAAGPVYKLLGKKDMGTSTFPPIGTPLIDGAIAFRQHEHGHTPVPNWPTFLIFAGRYLHAPAGESGAYGVSSGTGWTRERAGNSGTSGEFGERPPFAIPSLRDDEETARWHGYQRDLPPLSTLSNNRTTV